MILYLTYNDQPSGVYWSQVTDVVAYLNTLGGPRVRLLALVSARDYFGIRRKIKAHSPDALVLPMVPQMRRWRANAALVKMVCRWWHPTGIMARGVLAMWMGLRARDKGLVKSVCFDARGAYAAEWEEYRIIEDDALIMQFRTVEAEAVQASDLRLAVSQALVQHWRERYGYVGDGHVVLPCTLGVAHAGDQRGGEERRKELGYAPEDVVLVYAGSTAGWQSFTLLRDLLHETFTRQSRVKMLFLSPPDTGIDKLAEAFPGRVVRKWVPAEAVPQWLCCCDAALLLREDSITNRVASPTKFAEYLACGLPVVISAHIGDFSEAVEQHGLGIVQQEGQVLPVLQRPSTKDRERYRAYAQAQCTKDAHKASYQRLLKVLG